MKNICKVNDCNSTCHGRGYCKLHYQRLVRGSEMLRDFRPPVQHRLSKHPYYTKWANMLDRCYNQNCKFYVNYGGRGIGVYEPWRTEAKSFIEYIFSLEKPSELHNSIDRIDNDGDYKPGNLRWATKSQQVANRRMQSNNKSTLVKGVYLSRNKFRSRINVNKRRVDVGSFATIEEAITARQKAEQEYYG